MNVLQRLFKRRKFWLAVVPDEGAGENGSDVIELHYANKSQRDAIWPILMELRERGLLRYWSETGDRGLPYLVMEPTKREGNDVSRNS